MVTGGAGFIGSNLTDRLLAAGHDVVVYDNLSTGFRRFLDQAVANGCRFVQGDLADTGSLEKAMSGIDVVFHLAANADVRFGTNDPLRDLRQNTIATSNVLEAMRRAGVRRIAFSSTGAIYGEAKVIPTPEDGPFPVQTSFYGASKLAGEALIEAYCEAFGFQGYIFRFVSILGGRYAHGHIFDFYRKLREDPTRLHVLGNGLQKKSYLYVQDCIDAILLVVETGREKVSIFNLGTEEYCTVNESLGYICGRLGISPRMEYAGGDRGWVGDSPFIFPDVTRIKSLGWAPKVSIRDGVVRTLEFLMENPWVLESRR
jgi:UDP-glucose 4-epimerase